MTHDPKRFLNAGGIKKKTLMKLRILVPVGVGLWVVVRSVGAILGCTENVVVAAMEGAIVGGIEGAVETSSFSVVMVTVVSVEVVVVDVSVVGRKVGISVEVVVVCS
jgi:hypothetical protein